MPKVAKSRMPTFVGMTLEATSTRQPFEQLVLVPLA
jgi:hypothetical protein